MIRYTVIGWPLYRAGWYFQVFTVFTAALTNGSSPRITCTSATVPSARITTFSTTVPVLPEARASWGYGGGHIDPPRHQGAPAPPDWAAPPHPPPRRAPPPSPP